MLAVIVCGPLPGAALVADLHPHMAAPYFSSYTELAARLAGPAVHGDVRDQLRQAKDGVIGGRVAIQNPGQELPSCVDLLRNGGESAGPRDQRCTR